MAITALPTAPQRTNAPDVFATRADAWVAALDQFTTEANALQTDVNAKQVLASASEVAAELAETNAEAAQAASEAARDISIANASGTVAAGSAKDWASKAEDSQVITGQYSALHWAAKAAASVAVLPEGTINDAMVAGDRAWSSNKTNNEILVGRKIVISEITESYTVIDADRSKIIRCSGAFTLTITAAATVGSGWFFYAQNIGSGNITIDPNGSETIDGQANAILEPGNFFLIASNGTGLKCIRLNKPQPHYITSSQTWTCPAGVYLINVELWGAGGSGNRQNGTTYAFSGGNGGAYSRKKIVVSPGITKSITIGTGGASKTTAGNGLSGGASSFSGDITCSGGAGGAYLYVNGYASTASGGDLNIAGGVGYVNAVVASYSSTVSGQSFSTTPIISLYNNDGINGNFPGGGGSATVDTNSGAGANGLCIIWY